MPARLCKNHSGSCWQCWQHRQEWPHGCFVQQPTLESLQRHTTVIGLHTVGDLPATPPLSRIGRISQSGLGGRGSIQRWAENRQDIGPWVAGMGPGLPFSTPFSACRESRYTALAACQVRLCLGMSRLSSDSVIVMVGGSFAFLSAP